MYPINQITSTALLRHYLQLNSYIEHFAENYGVPLARSLFVANPRRSNGLQGQNDVSESQEDSSTRNYPGLLPQNDSVSFTDEAARVLKQDRKQKRRSQGESFGLKSRKCSCCGGTYVKSSFQTKQDPIFAEIAS